MEACRLNFFVPDVKAEEGCLRGATGAGEGKSRLRSLLCLLTTGILTTKIKNQGKIQGVTQQFADTFQPMTFHFACQMQKMCRQVSQSRVLSTPKVLSKLEPSHPPSSHFPWIWHKTNIGAIQPLACFWPSTSSEQKKKCCFIWCDSTTSLV